MSVALATTWEERLADLGNIPASRVRTIPTPRTATVEDLVRLSESEGRLYELVDGTLVEKAMGWQESLLAGVIVQKRREYFHAGVELLWMVDHRSRTVTVFRSPQDALVVTDGQTLDGGKVLPGWYLNVSELFSRLDRSTETQ